MEGAKSWDPALYDGKHSFVWKAGEGLVELLAPQRGETILDLGCGTGHLTQRIAESGAAAWGIDNSAAMIAQARAAYPSLRFEIADGQDFSLPQTFDAVFSNAALHWMTRPAGVVACVRRALRDGGRFVAELGGKGNVAAVHTTVAAAIRAAGHTPMAVADVHYFPSLGEYAALLESHGFRVDEGAHFDRPSRLEGEAGLRHWIAMFCDRFLSVVPEAEREAIVSRVEQELRPVLHDDGAWHVDYVRVRVRATRRRDG